MLFDTDVLIWVLRGQAKAVALINETEDRGLSVVSYVELLQGARDRQELRLIKSFLGDAEFRMAPLSENIGHRASIYMEEFGLNAGMTLADALLSATAVELDQPFCTANMRHYKAVSELRVKQFRP